MTPGDVKEQMRQPIIAVPAGALIGVLAALGIVKMDNDPVQRFEQANREMQSSVNQLQVDAEGTRKGVEKVNDEIRGLNERFDKFFDLFIQSNSAIEVLDQRVGRNERDIGEIKRTIDRWSDPVKGALEE